MANSQKKNSAQAQPKASALKKVRRSVYLQAGLAGMTILLTLVIVFAMTAAWYTNIVQTSGLTFEVAPWGFDGEITVTETPIKAAPGDDGVVGLSVTNDGADMSDISINVSKAAMDKEMQKRLFFYVDAQQTRNGEIMERVYLSNQESYTYTLFSHGDLILTDTFHNDAQLKWHWVYDVLGYYVLGTVNADGTYVAEQEFLRPIEYDYDEATTTFVTRVNEEGEETLILELETVDGVTSVDKFLTELSKNDGYPGQIDPALKNEAGYYPVDVDEDGYGVWAYLCSYSEIEMNTQVDTALGKAAAEGNPGTYTARLTVSAQKSKTNIQLVSTASALQDAIAGGSGSVIQLDNDIVLDSSLLIAEKQRVWLDLNGHELESSTNIAIDAAPGSALTVTNGTITGQSDSGYGILATGAEVTMSNVAVTDVKYGVYVMDGNATDGTDSRIRMVGCSMNTTNNAITVLGNGDSSAQTTQLILENCEIVSGYNAISGNGTSTGSGKWGTDIQIINSTVTGKWSALYHPQLNSTATIYNSTLTGHTGIAVKGGTVSIIDSAISGTGEHETPEYAASGYTDTGDAVYIETGYGYEIVVNISGSSVLRSEHGLSLRIFETPADNVDINISGGSFEEEQPPEFLVEGVKQEETDDGFFLVSAQ